MRVIKIVSGGQSGVDRAALDVALKLGISCGGWCPRGRRAEDGRIADHYPLQETEGRGYSTRTSLNVRESDATLILNTGPLEGGTEFTRVLAAKLHRPCLVAEPDRDADLEETLRWLLENRVAVLNVAGPRESKRPGIYELSVGYLTQLLS